MNKKLLFCKTSALSLAAARLAAARLATVGLAALVGLALTGCGGSEPASDESAVAPTIDHLALATEAVANPSRPEADRADDANRKPADVVAFFGVEPGMKVLDLLAGGGYYTEIVAGVVGEEGHVICQNNQAYRGFIGDAYDQRFADNRLPNVQRLDSEVLELALEPDSLDGVIYILGYHDIWFRPDQGGWEELDAPGVLSRVYAALKPGGFLGIVDHAAAEGANLEEVANSLHRIDEQVVRDGIEAAGFVLDGSSDVLRNPEDDHTVQVFDPSIRRQTDRFVLRYRKPA